jgi:transcriptional regulator with XRE-family HTH domain
MQRGHWLARLFRALSGATQKDFGRKAGIHPELLVKYEMGRVAPGPEHLDRLAKAAGLTVEAGDQLLELAEARRRPRLRTGRGVDDGLTEPLSALLSSFQERLLALPPPVPTPRAEDRKRAREQWAFLKDLPDDQARMVVAVALEFQSWALVERVCEESVLAAPQDPGRAVFLAGLAREIASRVRGPEGFPERVQGFACAHEAQALRAAGEPGLAEDVFREARRLWDAGSDPDNLLGPRFGAE